MGLQSGCHCLCKGSQATNVHDLGWLDQVFEEALHEYFQIPIDYGVVVTIPIGYPLGQFGPVTRIPAEQKT